MKVWLVRMTWPEKGEIIETWVEARGETEAAQKFFRRKQGAEILLRNEPEPMTLEITEADPVKSESFRNIKRS